VLPADFTRVFLQEWRVRLWSLRRLISISQTKMHGSRMSWFALPQSWLSNEQVGNLDVSPSHGAAEPHPVVIISPQKMCGNPVAENLNVLLCTSIRPDMTEKPGHMVLNEDDGLSGKTRADCTFVYTIQKKHLIGPALGSVVRHRRDKISKLIFDILMTT